jgi:predicted RNase H-like HicB family nuclease
MNAKYEIVVLWSEADGRFLAGLPELPTLITDGATRVEALHDAGWPVPEPSGRLAFA